MGRWASDTAKTARLTESAGSTLEDTQSMLVKTVSIPAVLVEDLSLMSVEAASRSNGTEEEVQSLRNEVEEVANTPYHHPSPTSILKYC